jgi:hypothetical protein
MPSRKIVSILIFCVGVVLSIWFLSKDNNPKTTILDTKPSVSVSDELRSYSKDDWKNILTKIDQGTTTILTEPSSSVYPDEGTQTDLMSRDFMAQYLLLKQGGTQITSEQALQIAQNTLSSAEYTKATGVKYTTDNLHINPKTSKEITENYITSINQSLINRSPKNLENELVILNKAITSGKESDLAKLDPIIIGYKGLIGDFLQITVPSDAVKLHLNFLNAMSNVLSNIEAMRQTFSDPVRSFSGVSQYKQHAFDLGLAMEKLKEYSLSKK